MFHTLNDLSWQEAERQAIEELTDGNETNFLKTLADGSIKWMIN